jgi:hypothetical protein
MWGPTPTLHMCVIITMTMIGKGGVQPHIHPMLRPSSEVWQGVGSCGTDEQTLARVKPVRYQQVPTCAQQCRKCKQLDEGLNPHMLLSTLRQGCMHEWSSDRSQTPDGPWSEGQTEVRPTTHRRYIPMTTSCGMHTSGVAHGQRHMAKGQYIVLWHIAYVVGGTCACTP